MEDPIEQKITNIDGIIHKMKGLDSDISKYIAEDFKNIFLFVYEFPIEQPDVYKLKAEGDVWQLGSKILSMKGITIRDNNVKGANSECSEYMKQVIDAKNISCDPLKFDYDLININGLAKVSYLNVYDPVKYHKEIANLKSNLGSIISDELDWFAQCLHLPEINDDKFFVNDVTNTKLKPEMLTKEYYEKILTNFKKVIMEDKEQAGNKDVFDVDSANVFVVKMELPKGSQLCVFGDLHSSVHTLIRSLLRLVRMGYINKDWVFKPNFYIFFLGDIIDRGLYGPETLITIMKLKIKNPHNVFIIRGNHEDKEISKEYGFYYELLCKVYNNCSKEKDKNAIYNKLFRKIVNLPSAIFLRTDTGYIQFCHGGLYRRKESIKEFLEGSNASRSFYSGGKDSSGDLKFPRVLDFQWSDFQSGYRITPYENNGDSYKDTGRGFGKLYNATEAKEYMKEVGIIGVVRGHQDQYNNTKLIDYTGHSNPLEWENYLKQRPFKTTLEKYRGGEGNDYSIKLPFGFNNNFNTLFAPVYTFTTAVSPRIIDSDGFGLLTL